MPNDSDPALWLGMTGDQWFTIIMTLGAALVGAAVSLVVSLLTQWRADKERKADRNHALALADLESKRASARHWADRRFEAHQRFLATAQEALSRLSDDMLSNEDPNIEVHLDGLVAMNRARSAVQVLGSAEVNAWAKAVINEFSSVRRSISAPSKDLAFDDLYREMLDKTKPVTVAIGEYLEAARAELGTTLTAHPSDLIT